MSLSSGEINSGAWEIVGKAQKKKAPGKVGAGSKAPNPSLKTQRIEDVFPIHQVEAMYSGVYDIPMTEEKKNTSSPSKKTNKQPIKKSEAPPKKEIVKLPTTIEAAFIKISSSELKSLLEKVKSEYPSNQVLWYRSLASYFNTALKTQNPNPNYIENPFSKEPLSLLSKDLKKLLTPNLESLSDINRASIFETFLANVAHDLHKGSCVHGYLLLLQLFCEVFPSLAINNFERLGELRGSYINRPVIGTVLLWSLGQGGRKDISVGLKVWLEFMVPFLGNKNYSKYVINYLAQLLRLHSNTKRKNIYPSMFLVFFDVFFTSSVSLKKDLHEQLMKQYPIIKSIAIETKSSSQHELFSVFLRRLSNTSQENQEETDEILDILSLSLFQTPTVSLSQWLIMYTSYSKASTVLLTHIKTHWRFLEPSLGKASSTFEDSLLAFQKHNVSSPSYSKASEACEILLSKLHHQGSFSFPWKFSNCLLIILITILLYSDVQKHGSYKNSRTGIFMNDIGLYEMSTQAYEAFLTLYNAGNEMTRIYVPIIYEGIERNLAPLSPYFSTFFSHLNNLMSLMSDKAKEILTEENMKIVTDSFYSFQRSVIFTYVRSQEYFLKEIWPRCTVKNIQEFSAQIFELLKKASVDLLGHENIKTLSSFLEKSGKSLEIYFERLLAQFS